MSFQHVLECRRMKCMSDMKNYWADLADIDMTKNQKSSEEIAAAAAVAQCFDDYSYVVRDGLLWWLCFASCG